MLELRHLRTLCAIADAGSLGKAAATLGYSQPAISTQLRRLEEMLGGQLFVRSNSGVELTAFGLEIVDQAKDILDRVSALGRSVTRQSDNPVTLRVGATITPVLSGLVARIRAGSPNTTVVVRSEYSTGILLELLEDNVIDLAIVLEYPDRGIVHSETLAHRSFAAEPSFIALPSSHPLAQHAEVPLGELAGDAWFVTPDDGAGWPEVFYEACERAGFRPIRIHEMLDEKNLQRMIVSGVGITACQPTMTPIYGMVVKPLAGNPIWYRQVLAWRRDGPAAEIASTLCVQAGEAYRELMMQTPHYRAWAAGGRSRPPPGVRSVNLKPTPRTV